MDCRDMIMSEEYADFIMPVNPYTGVPSECSVVFGDLYEVHYEHMDPEFNLFDVKYGYYALPKLFGLLDTGSMEASGIIRVHNQPTLNLKGEGVLIGFIDTGIDYTNQVFLNPDGTTRILAIWDQTDNTADSPPSFGYGRQFTADEINTALKSEKPLNIVPTTDEDGHGTFMAGIAAGNEVPDGSFVGAAPEAKLAVVKLKPCKQYLRKYYNIKDGAIAYQENDVLAGIEYLKRVSDTSKLPLVLCFGIGTNSGAHNGTLVISRVINHEGSVPGSICVVAAGNETDRYHHYEGRYRHEEPYEEVEIRVAEDEAGFMLELWAYEPEVYSVAIRSPAGEFIPEIPVKVGATEHVNFVFEDTEILVQYHVVVEESGGYLIMMRFDRPSPGVWSIQVHNSLYTTGKFNIWLPMEQFISPGTVFLRPSPDETLTSPADTQYVIASCCYNHETLGIYQHSSRGYTTDGRVKPDIAAPGVNVYGPAPRNRFVQKTGSSISAAHVAGASALLQEWAIKRLDGRLLSTQDAMAYFIRGATRRTGTDYPNREWGYGILNVYDVFDRLSEL